MSSIVITSLEGAGCSALFVLWKVGDSNEYTQHTLYDKNTQNTPYFLFSGAIGRIS